MKNLILLSYALVIAVCFHSAPAVSGAKLKSSVSFCSEIASGQEASSDGAES